MWPVLLLEALGGRAQAASARKVVNQKCETGATVKGHRQFDSKSKERGKHMHKILL
jgi:hypothetical protein